MASKVRFDIENDYSRHEVDPWDPVPFRILAEKKLQDVGWEMSHTNLVAGLLQRLYHCEAASRIETDDFWWSYTHELDFDIEEQNKGTNMAGTAVADKKQTAPAEIFADMAEFAGEGMDSIGTEDMQIPFLRILQPLSPEVQKGDAKFIKGASAGDLFNTVTQQVWDGEDGVVLIPCGYTVKYLEFGLREAGGGFFGELDPNSPDVKNTTRNGTSEILPSGNELVRSAQHLVLIVDTKTGQTQQAICDMKKTQLKVSRRWNTQMRMVQYEGPNGLFNPPMWGTAWKMTVISESNDKGTWYNYGVSRVEPTEVPSSAFHAAKEFFQSFRSGDVQTQAGTQDEMNKQSKAASSNADDDIPF